MNFGWWCVNVGSSVVRNAPLWWGMLIMGEATRMWGQREISILLLILLWAWNCSWASLMAQMAKNPSASGRPGFNPWVGKIPWRREWLPTPVFWPGELHGQRSLAADSPWGRKESDTTKWLSLSLRYMKTKLNIENLWLKAKLVIVKSLCFASPHSFT